MAGDNNLCTIAGLKFLDKVNSKSYNHIRNVCYTYFFVYLTPTTYHPNGFCWGHQCSWTLTPANSMKVSSMHRRAAKGSNQE